MFFSLQYLTRTCLLGFNYVTGPQRGSKIWRRRVNSDLIEKRMYIKFSMTPILFLYFFHAACPKNILVSTKNTFSCGLAHIYNNEAPLYQVVTFIHETLHAFKVLPMVRLVGKL